METYTSIHRVYIHEDTLLMELAGENNVLLALSRAKALALLTLLVVKLKEE